MIGHDNIRRVLETSPPQVTVFLGPRSVGKWTMAEHLCRTWGVDESGIIRVRDFSFRIDVARELVRLATTKTRHLRVFIVRLDAASEDAVNAILPMLENLPANTRVILISSTEVSAPIASRAEVYRFGLLTTDQVKAVLKTRNFGEGLASKLASSSGGQVGTALMQAGVSDKKTVVLAALRGLTERDPQALDNLADKWTDDHTTLLSHMALEAITKRWRYFTAAEVGGVSSRTMLHVLKAVGVDVRPKLFVRSTLVDVAVGAF